MGNAVPGRSGAVGRSVLDPDKFARIRLKIVLIADRRRQFSGGFPGVFRVSPGASRGFPGAADGAAAGPAGRDSARAPGPAGLARAPPGSPPRSEPIAAGRAAILVSFVGESRPPIGWGSVPPGGDRLVLIERRRIERRRSEWRFAIWRALRNLEGVPQPSRAAADPGQAADRSRRRGLRHLIDGRQPASKASRSLQNQRSPFDGLILVRS